MANRQGAYATMRPSRGPVFQHHVQVIDVDDMNNTLSFGDKMMNMVMVNLLAKAVALGNAERRPYETKDSYESLIRPVNFDKIDHYLMGDKLLHPGTIEQIRTIMSTVEYSPNLWFRIFTRR